MAVRWPWTRSPEVRESYTDVIQTALYDHALGSVGKPQPQETSAVLSLLPPMVGHHLYVRRDASQSAGRCTGYSRMEARYVRLVRRTARRRRAFHR